MSLLTQFRHHTHLAHVIARNEAISSHANQRAHLLLTTTQSPTIHTSHTSLRGTKQSLHMLINVHHLLSRRIHYINLQYGLPKGGCVYIMTNQYNKVLYVGVSSELIGRVYDHKNNTYPESFTARYNCHKLVHYLYYPHIEEAINAEKTLKGSSRKHKQKLVNEFNPEWRDLYDSILE